MLLARSSYLCVSQKPRASVRLRDGKISMHSLPVTMELLVCDVRILAEKDVEAEVWLSKGPLRAAPWFKLFERVVVGGDC